MIKKAITVSCLALLCACGNDTQTTTPVEVKADTSKTESGPKNELAEFKFSTLVINIPSPFEIISLLPKAGVPFNAGLPNKTENETKYTTTTRKGLNYGVYVVDLIYLSTNEQFSQVKGYLKTTRNLAQSLDCAESFDNVAGARLEQNIDKKDTINKVIDQLYSEMDGYLRSNERLLTATHILVGSWVESQYLTATVVKDVEKTAGNEILFTKINESKLVLDRLVELLGEFEKEKDFKPFITDLKDLQGTYKELKGTGSDIDKALLAKIQSKLAAIRTKITG